MAIIQSGATSDLWTIDAASKAGRSTLYDAAGAALGTSANPVRVRESTSRVLVGVYAATSFRTAGLATTAHNVFTIENPGSSSVKVAVKKLVWITDMTALLATVSPAIRLSRTTALPSGGTALAISKLDTANPSAQSVIRGATASDGGAATAITATPLGAMWTVLLDRLHTAAGFVLHTEKDLIYTTELNPLVINAGEAVVVQVVQASLVTFHYQVNIVFEEYT